MKIFIDMFKIILISVLGAFFFISTYTQSIDWEEIGVNEHPSMANTGSNSTRGIGRVDYIAFDPNDPERMFACSPWGGLFISDNNGESWYSAGLEYMIIEPGLSCIFIDPEDDNSNTLYVATGNADHIEIDPLGLGRINPDPLGRKSYGLYRTTDGGIEWESIGPIPGIDIPECNPTWYDGSKTRVLGYLINDIIQGPNGREHLIVSTSCGIIETQNALADDPDWDVIKEGNFFNVVAKPDEPHRIFYSEQLKADAKIYEFNLNTRVESPPINTGVTTSYEGVRSVLRFSKDDENNADQLFIFIHDGSISGYGAEFIRYDITNGQPVPKGNFHLGSIVRPEGVHVSNNSADILYAPSNHYYIRGIDVPRKSENGLDNNDLIWDNNFSNTYIHVDQHHIVESPWDNSLWVANDGGIYKYENGGFQEKNDGLAVSTVYKLNVHKNDPNIFIAGYQDCGTMISRKDLDEWDAEVIYGGDAFHNLIDHRVDGRFYCSWTSASIRMNQNSPGNYTSRTLPNGGYQFNYDFDYSSDEDIYRGSSTGLNKHIPSTNKNEPWSTIPYADQRISSIFASPTHPSHLYISANGTGVKKIFKSEVGGGADVSKWNELGNDPSAPSNLSCNKPGVVDYDNPDHIWIVEGSPMHVYSVNTKTDQWSQIDEAGFVTDIINPETNEPRNIDLIGAIQHEFNSNQAIYVNTTAGIFYRDLTLPSWVNVTGDLPNCLITDIKVNNKQQKILAGTFGRGVWETPLYCSAIPGDFNLPSNFSNLSKHVEGTITGNGTVSGLVTLRAGEEIVFNPGFETADGANFMAITRPCGSSGGGLLKTTEEVYRDLIKINEPQIEEEVTDEIYSVYPNPSNGLVYIKSSNNTEFSYKVYNSVGALILEKSNVFDDEFDLSGKPSGMYFIQVASENYRELKKIIIR